MLDGTFLEGTDAHKGSWRDERDASLEKKGISPRYYWTGKGRGALEVAYETAAGFAAAATVREVWKRRHGRAAAPLLLVVAYAANGTQRATVCGPAGEDPRVVALDFDRLVVYFVVPLGYGVFAVRQLRIAGGAPPRLAPLQTWLRIVLGVQAAIMLIWGTALFLVPQTMAGLWPWALTPLTGQAVGAWLIGVGVTAAHMCWENDFGRVYAAMAGYSAFGALQLLALARFGAATVDWSGAGGWIYLLFILSILGVGLYGWFEARRAGNLTT